METVENTNASLATLVKENAGSIVKDTELRKMTPNSDEFAAAVKRKFDKTEPQSTESAPVENTVKVESENLEKASGEDDLSTSKAVKKRFDTLTGRAKSAEEERDKLRAEIEVLRAGTKSEEKPESKPVETKTTVVGFDKPKPVIHDFETLPEYQEALADWKYDQRDFQRSQENQRKEYENKAKTAFESYLEKGSVVEKDNGLKPGEFAVLLSDPDLQRVAPVPAEMLISGEFGPQITYEILSDETKKAKFLDMTPPEQVRYIGRLEGKFETQAESTDKKVQTTVVAKAPPTSIPKGNAKASTDGTKLSGRDFEQWRNEQRRAKGKTIY